MTMLHSKLAPADYFVTKSDQCCISEFDFKVVVGSYNVYCKKSSAFLVRGDNFSILILGEYVQADYDPELGLTNFEQFASLGSKLTLNQVYTFIDSLAGHFVCFLELEGRVVIIPDATASLPVFYTADAPLSAVSSVETLLKPPAVMDEAANDVVDILNSLPPGQVLPYDLCATAGVYCLLPNHYLCLTSGRAHRRDLNIDEVPKISLGCVTQKSLAMIARIVGYYSTMYDIKCPLTGGLDSRVVALALKKYSHVNESYTFQHPHLKTNSPDIVLPPKIAAQLGFTHAKIYNSSAFASKIGSIWEQTIAYPISMQTVSNAENIRASYPAGTAITPGDIIGQIGKSSVGGCISNALFSPRMLRCKTHYYSSKGLVYERLYLDGLSKSEGSVSDFYAWEIRCGKWATRTSMFYRRAGIVSINIFNCTNLIRLWCRVPRQHRVSGALHHAMISALAHPEIMVPPSKISKYSIRANSILFYAASMAKFHIKKIRFRKLWL